MKKQSQFPKGENVVIPVLIMTYDNFNNHRPKKTKPIKANLKILLLPKERKEKMMPEREGQDRSEHLLINREKVKIPLTQSRPICYKKKVEIYNFLFFWGNICNLIEISIKLMPILTV
ncbi:MAG: hypothetical protein ACYSUX_08365 [Planctomycetota bacterium]